MLSLHIVDIVPGNWELRQCRERLHEEYTKNRCLTEALTAELEAQRETDSEKYRYLLQELLAWAAYLSDGESFAALLELARRWQDEAGCRFGLLRRLLPAWMQQPVDQAYEIITPFGFRELSHALLITDREPYLGMLIDTLGADMDCRREPWLYNGSCYRSGSSYLETDLPDPAILTLCRHGRLVQRLWEKGCCGDGAVQGGRGMFLNGGRMRCHSLLTAALLSQDPALLDFVLTQFPALSYRREMLAPLAATDRDMQLRFLQAHPELPALLSWKDLCRMPAVELLRAVLQRTGSVPSGTRLSLPTDMLILGNEKNIPEILRLMCSYASDEETRLTNLRQYLRCFGRYCSPEEADLAFFPEQLPPGSDLTHLLTQGEKRAELWNGLFSLLDACPHGEDEPPYRIDIYRLGAHVLRRLHRVQLTSLMNTFSPLRIEESADPLTKRLIAKSTGDAELIEHAIRRCFITAVNAPFLPLPRHGGREVARLLLPFGRDRALRERYEWRREA